MQCNIIMGCNPDFAFPGRELLPWLWFKSAERNGSILIPGTRDIEVLFLRRLVLESGEGDSPEWQSEEIPRIARWVKE